MTKDFAARLAELEEAKRYAATAQGYWYWCEEIEKLRREQDAEKGKTVEVKHDR